MAKPTGQWIIIFNFESEVEELVEEEEHFVNITVRDMGTSVIKVG